MSRRKRGVRDDFKVSGLSVGRLNLPFTEIGESVGGAGLGEKICPVGVAHGSLQFGDQTGLEL